MKPHFTNTGNPIDFPKTEKMMNERIKELAREAGYGSRWTTTEQFEQFVEKFAWLIIAKCIEEAGDPADGLILDDTWHDGVRASIWSIQQYFGVRK